MAVSWIPVEKLRPPEMVSVLVWHEPPLADNVQVCFWRDGAFHSVAYAGFSYHPGLEATHWMPLPPGPQQEMTDAQE